MQGGCCVDGRQECKMGRVRDRKARDDILASTFGELPGPHGFHFGSDLQYVLLRRVNVIDSRSEQVLDQSRLVPVLGSTVVLWTQS